jgi:hypothetical protein
MRRGKPFIWLVSGGLFALQAVSARADLLVGAANGTAVHRYCDSGDPLGDFTSGGTLGSGWSALAFSPDGDLYVRGWSFGGAIDRYDGQTGAFINQVVPPTGGSGASAILFDLVGNLLVNEGNRVDRYDRITGAFLGTFVAQGSGGLAGGLGMRFGPDGNLYIANTNFPTNTFNVLRYNGTTGAFIDEFVASGSGGLGGNADLLFGPDGHLYVADLQNNVVRRYNGTTGAFIDTFASGGGLANPFGLAFGPDCDLFVSGSINSSPPNSVFRYDGATGAFRGVFATDTNANPSYITFFTAP